MMNGNKKTKIINLFGGPGCGKCFAQGTRILLYDGSIKPVENIKEGDQLMGIDSSPRNVLYLSSGFGRMFKITPTKGNEFVVNENHILSLKYNKHYEQTVNITVKDFLNLSESKRNRMKIYNVPIDFNSDDILEVDPYFLGLWLGDGITDLSSVRITTADIEIINYLNKFSKKFNYTLNQHSHTNESAHTYCISPGNIGGVQNILTEKMRFIGMEKEKHIPHIYKTSSRKNRLKLLAGLIDSDGYKNAPGCYEYVTKLNSLAKDVLYLCHSLGYAAYISSKTFKGKIYFRISISGIDELPCLIPRKKPDEPKKRKNVLRRGFSIKEIEPNVFYGFETDKDHLFLLDDFTVVHNSTTAWGLAHQMKLKHMSLELVPEYAKSLLWSNRLDDMQDQQEYIFAKQNHMLHRLRDKVDYVVVDSPVLLNHMYTGMSTNPWAARDAFKAFVVATFHTYDNINFLIERPEKFEESGRLQNEEEAKQIDTIIMESVSMLQIPYLVVSADDVIVDNILRLI